MDILPVTFSIVPLYFLSPWTKWCAHHRALKYIQLSHFLDVTDKDSDPYKTADTAEYLLCCTFSKLFECVFNVSGVDVEK
jgi:hypothetical protein